MAIDSYSNRIAWSCETGKGMTQDDIIHIKVNGQGVGILGLAPVLTEMADKYAERSDEETASELLRWMSRKNYIPESAKLQYKKAFLREFKKFLGESYEEESPHGPEIKILGPGCARCDRLAKDIMDIMSEINIAGEVEHIRDTKEIAGYGVMGTPALVVNGKVKCAGRVPTRKKIIKWLEEVR